MLPDRKLPVGRFKLKKKKPAWNRKDPFLDRVGDEQIETVGIPELDSVKLLDAAHDPSFDTELQYEGYDEISEYDNQVLKQDVGSGKGRVMKELKLKDREALSELNEEAEENSLDPQNHQERD